MTDKLQCPFCGGPAVKYIPHFVPTEYAKCGMPQRLGDDNCPGKQFSLPVAEWNGLSLSMRKARRADYVRGYEDGLACYAWYKNGEQFVGTCGDTLKKAKGQLEKLWNFKPEN